MDKQRELNRKVLERIVSDGKFREEILDDPKGAMERAGFVWDGGARDDVSGYGLWPTTALTCPPVDTKPGSLTSGGGAGVVTTAITCTEPPPLTDPVQWPKPVEPNPGRKIKQGLSDTEG